MPAIVDEQGNTHASDRDRRAGYIDDEQQWEPVPCGEWFDGGIVLCDHHTALASADYPQGWAYYPGDVCPHHKYTGGSGVDWMCGPCEDGPSDEDLLPEATFMLKHAVETAREDLARITRETSGDFGTEVYDAAQADWYREISYRANRWVDEINRVTNN